MSEPIYLRARAGLGNRLNTLLNGLAVRDALAMDDQAPRPIVLKWSPSKHCRASVFDVLDRDWLKDEDVLTLTGLKGRGYFGPHTRYFFRNTDQRHVRGAREKYGKLCHLVKDLALYEACFGGAVRRLRFAAEIEGRAAKFVSNRPGGPTAFQVRALRGKDYEPPNAAEVHWLEEMNATRGGLFLATDSSEWARKYLELLPGSWMCKERAADSDLGARDREAIIDAAVEWRLCSVARQLIVHAPLKSTFVQAIIQAGAVPVVMLPYR
jgi:hypothetical protein